MQPGDRFKSAGYSDWQQSGENIAAGQQTARDVIRGWIQSPGHCKNLFFPDFTQIGFGIETASSPRYTGPFWGQGFARPESAGNAPSASLVDCPREPATRQPAG